MTNQEHDALRESLGVYALGKADAHERHAIHDHLEHCPDCRHELTELGTAVDLLHQLRLTPHHTVG